MSAPVSRIAQQLERVQGERIRRKVNVECELVLTDGTRLTGFVFIGHDERVQDLLNDPKPFFPLRMENAEILIVNKAIVAICKPLDITK